MDKNKFVMRWVRFTLLIAIFAFIGSLYAERDLSLSLAFFTGIIFSSTLIYCAVFIFMALLFWTWNGSKPMKKNLPNESMFGPYPK